jgi:hypothetical protein
MSKRNAFDAPRSVADIVLSNDVAGLAARAGKLADLGTRLNRVLPSALAAQVHLANLRDRQLVFFATSPAWATRLRYSQALVLEAARQLGLDARGVVVKVAAAPVPEATAPNAHPLSESAARHLALAAKLLA